MKKIFRYCTLLLIGCIGLGGIVSKLEKKKGWVVGHKPKGVYEEHIKRPLDFGLALFALAYTLVNCYSGENKYGKASVVCSGATGIRR